MSEKALDKVFDLIKEQEIEFVDFRFTDSRGKWRHISYSAAQIDNTILINGLYCDGSAIEGWRDVNQSDMLLIPDLETAFIDPFTAQPTLCITCNVKALNTNSPFMHDPRSTAKRAEQYFTSLFAGGQAYFEPTIDFFVLDDIRYKVNSSESYYAIDAEEAPYNSGKTFDAGNFGHRATAKAASLVTQPIDLLNDIRAEMVTILKAVGITPLSHHHEAAPSQCKLGFASDTLVATADNVQRYKYVIQNVAHSYGKSATFMPKLFKDDHSSGMHIHQSLWQNNQTLFAGDQYSDLSETALYYIGGILKHAKALNAFTNPTTNSYKRLAQGSDASSLLAYSKYNRAAAIRIPYIDSANDKKLNICFPDPSANPYYAFTAILMAGLDGIANKIHPGEAVDYNFDDSSEEEAAKIPLVCSSLKEALEALSIDREFLKKGGVFTDAQIDAYIKQKSQDVQLLDRSPHPVEFQLYYSS